MVIFMAWLAYVLSFSFLSVFNQDRPAEKSSNPISNSCDFKCKRFFGFDFFFAESGNKCSSQQLKCICFLEEKKIRETIDSTTTNDLKSAKKDVHIWNQTRWVPLNFDSFSNNRTNHSEHDATSEFRCNINIEMDLMDHVSVR